MGNVGLMELPFESIHNLNHTRRTNSIEGKCMVPPRLGPALQELDMR